MTTAFISHSDCGRHDTGWGHPEHVGRIRAIPKALREDAESGPAKKILAQAMVGQKAADQVRAGDAALARRDIAAAVEDATDHAEAQPDPDPATATRYVYADVVEDAG